MTAQEALAMSEQANKAELTEVYHAIQLAAQRGDMFIHIYSSLTRQQNMELKNNGFTVEDISEHYETVIYIGWAEKKI